MPMASTVALMIAATSSSQTKPDESKSLWPSATSKKYRGMGNLQLGKLPETIMFRTGRLSWLSGKQLA
jgi:hypothetical protein